MHVQCEKPGCLPGSDGLNKYVAVAAADEVKAQTGFFAVRREPRRSRVCCKLSHVFHPAASGLGLAELFHLLLACNSSTGTGEMVQLDLAKAILRSFGMSSIRAACITPIEKTSAFHFFIMITVWSF